VKESQGFNKPSKSDPKESPKKEGEKKDAQSPSTETAGPGAFDSPVNLGLMGETSTPGAVTAPGSSLGGDSGASFDSSSANAALMGANMGAKPGGEVFGDGSYLTNMNLGGTGADSSSGGAPGSVVGAYSSGVNYVSGSGGNGEYEDSELNDDSSLTDSASVPEQSETARYEMIYNTVQARKLSEPRSSAPGVFRFREQMIRQARNRLIFPRPVSYLSEGE
jgi:hypothetical protein